MNSRQLPGEEITLYTCGWSPDRIIAVLSGPSFDFLAIMMAITKTTNSVISSAPPAKPVQF